MKIETFKISENDLPIFKDACSEIRNVEIINYDTIENEVKIIYKYEHELFYLGQMYQLKKR